MVKSMTGFGRGEGTLEGINVKLEIKAVNHRYNDINVKMPRHMVYLEEYIKKQVKNNIFRGKTDVYVALEYTENSNVEVKVDLNLAESYKQAFDSIIERLQLNEIVSLKNIINMQDVIKMDKKELDEDLLKDVLDIALKEVIDDIMSMRCLEGENLKQDMLKKLDEIESRVSLVEKRSPLVVEEYRLKLKDRLEEVLDMNNSVIDMDRLNGEVVVFADKSSIDEEIVRLRSHVNQYKLILEDSEPVGRKLDFLIQEMNREINTIGSKANDSEISQEVVNIKSEIEKLREQVQNIE